MYFIVTWIRIVFYYAMANQFSGAIVSSEWCLSTFLTCLCQMEKWFHCAANINEIELHNFSNIMFPTFDISENHVQHCQWNSYYLR